MELFVPAMVFNPQLAGQVVRASGNDEEGYQVDMVGIVEKVEAEALLLRRGSNIRTIYAHEVSPEGITLGVARKFTLLQDNRPLDCDACGGHSDGRADCTVCGGTGRHPDGVPRMSDPEDDCMNGCGCPGSCKQAAREEWPE
ncbi:hypothetical protein [Paenibacillus sp. MMO-177]|uniref:hypothetical protein n=1 Tax=Paenibacillus sp. MMO-177 TaxID=3081289 RepID=UPI003019E473